MIRKVRTYSRLVLLTGLMLVLAQAAGATTYGGRLGVDYEFHTNDAKSDSLTSIQASQRAISNHFVEAFLAGSIVNDDFAKYVLRTKVYGAFLKAENELSDNSSYRSPALNNIFGQVTLFPNRSYPIQLFHSESNDIALKYEPKEAKTDGSLQPELRVVRRYDSESNLSGAHINVRASDKISIESDFQTRKMQTFRIYEFDEDKDIYIDARLNDELKLPTDTSPIVPDRDTTWLIEIGMVNTIEDDDVTLILNFESRFFNNRLPGLDSTVSVFLGRKSETPPIDTTHFFAKSYRLYLTYETGQYDDNDSDSRNNWIEFIEDFTSTLQLVDLRPAGNYYNSSLTYIRFRGNMSWVITDSPVGSPDDIDGEGVGFTTSMTYNNDENLLNTTKLDIGTRKDHYQNLTGSDIAFSNELGWEINEKFNLDMQSSLSSGESELVRPDLTISGQETGAFSNLLNLQYTGQRNKRAMFSHSYNNMNSDVVSSELSNVINAFRLMGGMPSGYRDHDMELAVIVTMSTATSTKPSEADPLLDSTTVSDSRAIDVRLKNGMTLAGFGFQFKPMNRLSYVVQGEVGVEPTKKLESMTSITSELNEHKLLGNLTLVGQHSYLRKIDVSGTDITTKYGLNVTIDRSLGKDYGINLGAGFLLTTYGGSTPTPGDNPNQESTAKPSEGQSSLSFGGNAQPLSTVFINGSHRVSFQTGATIGNTSLSVKVVVPTINLSLGSDIRMESREITGNPLQTRFKMENSASFSVRQIKLLFNYIFERHDRFGEIFTYSVLGGKITRSF